MFVHNLILSTRLALMDKPTQDQISHFCHALANAMDSWEMIAYVERHEIILSHVMLRGYEGQGLRGAALIINTLFDVANRGNIPRTLEFLEIVDACIGEADKEYKL